MGTDDAEAAVGSGVAPYSLRDPPRLRCNDMDRRTQLRRRRSVTRPVWPSPDGTVDPMTVLGLASADESTSQRVKVVGDLRRVPACCWYIGLRNPPPY